MTLNGALAGLVGITAGCATVDALGAAVIGAVAGILVVVAVEFIDFKLHVDDPVGAVAVHGINGSWGTIAVGLFSTSVPGGDGEIIDAVGLFYGGGAHQLGVQIIGILVIMIWTIITTTILFQCIKKINGLRVSKEDEIEGLDIHEHGLSSAYGGFTFAPEALYAESDLTPPVVVSPAVPVEAAVKVVNSATPGAKITKVTIITNQNQFPNLQPALENIGITGITVTNVLGYGMQKGGIAVYRGVRVESRLLPKIQVDIVICKVPVNILVSAVKSALYTGHVGDGKIFICDVENVIKVRTGEEGYDALQDEA
jgi:Amt family ammonium transporter